MHKTINTSIMSILKNNKNGKDESFKIYIANILILILLLIINLSLKISSETPVFLNFFLYIMGIQIYITFLMMIEDIRITKAKIWRYIIFGTFFCIIITFSHGYLLYIFLNIDKLLIIILAIIFTILYILTHFLANITLYILSREVTKKKINFFRKEYLLGYISALVGVDIFRKIIPHIKFPAYPNYELIYYYIIVSSIILISFVYALFKIAMKYRDVGFVYRPYIVGAFGIISLLLSIFLVLAIYIQIPYKEALFYPMFLYISSYILSVAFYETFGIEYPSLVNPKIRIIIPINILKFSKILITTFLIFVLISELKQPIDYKFIVALSLISLVAYIREIVNNFYKRTSIRYWKVLDVGLFFHAIATLILVSILVVKNIIYTIIILFSYIFYIIYIYDLRELSKKTTIKIKSNEGNILITILYLLVIWFSILILKERFVESISIVHVEKLIFASIALFLVTFPILILKSREGYGRVFELTKWSNLGYILSFLIFIGATYLYLSSKDVMLSFFILLYLLSFITELISIRELTRIEYVQREPIDDILELLNEHLKYWIRIDIIKDLVNKILQKYALDDVIVTIEDRKINIRGSEKDKITVSAALLLEMYRQENLKDKTILSKNVDDIKREIENILKEKVLLLPDDIKKEFDCEKVYADLFEKSIVELCDKFSSFMPLEDLVKIKNRIIEKLSGKISKKEFLQHFKSFLKMLREHFPHANEVFNELIVDYTNEKLKPFGFKIHEFLEIVPIGIEEYDEKYGGVSVGDNILLISEEKILEEDIIFKFLNKGVQEGDVGIYLTAEYSCDEVFEKISKNIFVLKVSLSKRDEIKEEDNCIILPIKPLIIQRYFAKVVKSIEGDVHKRVVVDVYPLLYKYLGWSNIKPMLLRQLEGLKRRKCTSLFVINSMIFKKYGEDIEKHVDIIIRIKKLKDKYVAHIRSPSRGFEKVISM